MGFSSLSKFREILANLPDVSETTLEQAKTRNEQLTKPPGALGRLEQLAVWYAGWRRQVRPQINHAQVVVFAGNHGVAARGVSAFPAEVTAQMVMNFEAKGAAVNQLCNAVGAKLTVQALELERPTADFTKGAAMSHDDFLAALQTGWQAIDDNTDLLVTGEMGIGNTTAAAAIACALYGGDAPEWVGRGTGVDDAGLKLKTDVVRAAIAANPQATQDPLEALRCLGGREIAAMAGAIVRARVMSVPVILDGFICTAAAACLAQAATGALDHCIAGHLSAEGSHSNLLKNINKKPLLSLGLRLGEASGGTLAISIIKAAVACHSGMATFAEAGVTDG